MMSDLSSARQGKIDTAPPILERRAFGVPAPNGADARASRAFISSRHGGGSAAPLRHAKTKPME
jgi:hypothetical protein